MGEADVTPETPVESEEEESMEGDEQPSDDADIEDQDESDEGAPEDEAPAEDDAEPVEDPVDNDNEAEESDSSDLGMQIMGAGDTTEKTITVKIMKGETEASSAATVEFVNDSAAKDGDTWKVKEETAVEFTVTPAAEIELADTTPVTATANDTTVTVTGPDSDTGVYTIANGAGDSALTGNVVITIKVVDKTYEVSAPAEDSAKGITWKIKESTAAEYATDASKVKVKKSDSVTVQATLAKEKADTVEVTLNEVTKELKATAEADGTVDFTIAAADLINADGTVKTLVPEYVVKAKVAYVLTAPETGAAVTIKDAKGTKVNAKGTEGEEAKTYELINGDTYTIEVTEGENAIALQKLAYVKVNSVELKYNAAKKAFLFTAKTDDAAKTIEVALKAAAAHTIAVMMDPENEDADAVATIATDAYKAANTGNDSDTVAAVPAADITSQTYDVWEGTPFSFTLAAKNASYYKIDKVEISTDDDDTWEELTAANGKYTIAKVEADATIKVSTSLDETQAYSITFADANGNVKDVKADLKGAANYTKVDADKAIKFMPATGNKVTFTVDALDGYSVEKVASGTTEADVIKPTGGVYEYTFAADTKTATITISTKAADLDDDKYVEFDVAEGVALAITDSKIKPVQKDGKDTNVYKLTAPKAAVGETAAVEGISELPFTLTVPYGQTLNSDTQTFADGVKVRQTAERAKSEDGSTWTYTYKAVAKLLADDSDTDLGTETKPYKITVLAAEEEMVSLTYADDSAEYADFKVLNDEYYYDYSSLSGTESVAPGATVILRVSKGQTLNVDDEDVRLDASNKYSFVAKLDDTKDNASKHVIDVQNAAAGDYTLAYAVNPEDASDITYDGTVDKDAVEVAYGSKVYLSLTKKGGAAAEISKYETSLETPKSKVKTEANGKAVVDVADADITVTLYTLKPETVGSITVENEVEAAKITLTCKDASGKTLTAKGLKNNGTIKLDATSTTSYALTLKEDKKALNAADYDEALDITYDTPGVVEATIVNGSLKVDTIKAEKAKITISAKDGSALLTFTVDGQKPALKMKSVTSVNQGMHDILVDVAADASIKPISDKFDLYYEVDVKQKEGASTNKKEGVYYLAADQLDAKGKIAPVSQLFTVNAETDKTKFANTYTFTVKLVAVDHGATVPTGDPKAGTPAAAALNEQLVKFASTASVAKDFKTRAEYYEDKLGVTKKTTKFYSGEQNVLVAIPKFSKNASHIEEIEAVVYNKDGSQAEGIEANVDQADTNTMEVRVDAEYYAAGNYDVVIYATATKDDGDYNMYQASAKVPITVQKSINYISVDYPSQIALVADSKGNKKDASITLKTTGYYEVGKAQTQKFTYSLLASGEDEDGYAYLGNSKNADKVIVKNNKITVKKDFITGADPDDNYFTVLVKANDYSDNDACREVRITVTDKALEIGSVQLVTYDDSTDKEKPLGATISTTDLEDAYVKITDTNGQNISPSLVTLTPNKGKVYVDVDYEYDAYIIVANGYQKNLTIKAVTKDGGKKSKSSIKYTINYPEGFTYNIGTPDVTNGAKINQTGDASWTYKGTGNNDISFQIQAVKGDNLDEYATTAKYNYSVKVTGGKATNAKGSDWGSGQADGYYVITPNKDEVKVTITDKSVKPAKTYDFTIKDTNWQTTAAPKASTKDKLYYVNDGDGYSIAQSLTYTVAAKNASYNAVKLTHVSGIDISNVEKTHDIKNNTTLEMKNLYPDGVGTAKYSAVYGDKIDGVFYPKTKATTLSIKVNKAGSPKAVAKYTINPSVSMSVPLQAKPVPVEGMVKFNKVLSANVKGEKNQFYDYFEVSDGMLQIKADKQNEAGLKALNELGKEHLNGYLVYQYSNADGDIIVKQDKITVVINNKAIPKYTADAVNVITAATVTADTNVKLGGTAVSIAQVASGTDGWTAAKGSGTGVVTLTAANPAAGTSKVDLYVIPTGSSNADQTNADKIKEVGVKVQVNVTVKAADDTKTKLTIAKGAKTPEASLNEAANQVDLTVTLVEGTDFTCNLSNATIATAAKVTDLTKITKADDKKAAEAVKSVTLNASTITIILNRDGLDGNKQYNVPVDLTFTEGAPETVSFSVKTEKVPTMDDVKKIVENELKDYAVSSDNYNNGASAASDVRTAANAIQIPALSGIKVSGAAAAADSETSKFADSTDSDGKVVKGHHQVEVTLTDVTKTENNTDKVTITVTEQQAEKSLGAALKEALEKYVLPGDDGKVAEGEIDITTANPTRWTVQKTLQDAADSVEKGKYNVTVIEFDLDTEDVPDPAPASKAVKVTNLTFTYTVKDAMTGSLVEPGTPSYSVDVARKDFGAPTVTEPVKPVVTTVEVSPTSASVTLDGTNSQTETFMATVKNQNGDTMENQTITWTLTGNESNDTTLNTTTGATVTLTVAADETATALKLKAACGSVESDEITISITNSGS